MQRWEYQTVTIQQDALQDTLNGYGIQGWQVAHIQQVPGQSYAQALLARPYHYRNMETKWQPIAVKT